jgi:hypothetical protein
MMEEPESGEFKVQSRISKAICDFDPSGDWLIPGFSRPKAEKERRAGGGSGLLGSWVGGPKTSASPPVTSPIAPRAPGGVFHPRLLQDASHNWTTLTGRRSVPGSTFSLNKGPLGRNEYILLLGSRKWLLTKL